MPNLSHMLWFNNQAEEATQLYTNIFKDSKILNKTNGPDGGVFTVEFEILGSKYTALNGGPMFSFTEAFSIVVLCQDQSEVDKYWDALTSNGGSA
jgi:predicted 3-demethylubiquinone-9 3-methyltransferase (glyoxalase superfamily)